ncbi:MAG TPA: TonB-dependent receptor [Opitutaceae bacterium]
MFCAAGAIARAQVATLDPFQVTATRGGPPPEETPVAVQVFDANALTQFPTITLDDTLREDASFSLFRRTDSLLSNPTSQGVSLREIGPSGASRSLVTSNGVPLNDPFGGWVLWDSAPRLSLRSATIVQGGGSGVWGNQALAGAIELIDNPFAGRLPSGALQGDFGAFDTESIEAEAAAAAGPVSVAVDARAFSTGGVFNLRRSDRGAVDRPLASHHEMERVTARDAISSAVQAQVSASLFDEYRNNGTALTHNGTRIGTVSATLDGSPSAAFAWSAVAYAEQESFEALFSSVSSDRSTETPSDNQFAVPATAVGGALTGEWTSAGGAHTSIGADARQVSGETREDYSYSDGNFTRLRTAGGTQDFAGVFVHQDRPILDGWHLNLELRADHWELKNGHDWEYLFNGSAPTLNRYPRQSGNEASPDLGVVGNFAPGWRWRAAVYRGFRVPTLNEFYRPYRVGNVSTLANPNLSPESMIGGESGFEYDQGPIHFKITGFADALDDAVGTVAVSSTPSLVTVQRANLNSVSVLGAEGSLAWDLGSVFTLEASYLCNDSRILRADAQPSLVGLRLQEVPRTTLTAAGIWHGPAGFRAEVRARWVSLEFDDPANTLRLPSATVADVEFSRNFGGGIEIYAAMENALNAAVMTSLTSAGLATYDAPQMLRAGLRWHW